MAGNIEEAVETREGGETITAHPAFAQIAAHRVNGRFLGNGKWSNVDGNYHQEGGEAGSSTGTVSAASAGTGCTCPEGGPGKETAVLAPGG